MSESIAEVLYRQVAKMGKSTMFWFWFFLDATTIMTEAIAMIQIPVLGYCTHIIGMGGTHIIGMGVHKGIVVSFIPTLFGCFLGIPSYMS